MRPIFVIRALGTADTDGIALAQQTGGAADLVLNGVFGSVAGATLDVQRKVGITSAGNLSAVTFTVFGTDDQGHVISESLAGPNANTVSTVEDYKTITRIAVNAAVGTNVEVGTTGVGASNIVPLDQYIAPFAVSLFAKVSGTANYTVQYTSDDCWASTFVSGEASWTNHPSMTAQAGNIDSNLAYPASGVRLLNNSGTGTVTLIIREAGIGGV